MKKNNTTGIILTFAALLLGIWIDSLWIKVPVTLLILFTAGGFIAADRKSHGDN